jgi:hypothetical protein
MNKTLTKVISKDIINIIGKYLLPIKSKHNLNIYYQSFYFGVKRLLGKYIKIQESYIGDFIIITYKCNDNMEQLNYLKWDYKNYLTRYHDNIYVYISFENILYSDILLSNDVNFINKCKNKRIH